jgi:hypothetical protein
MGNPSMMQQLAREYRREGLAAGRAHGQALRLSHHPIRMRLGWSLVGLGVRLTKDPFLGAMGHGRHVPQAQRAGTPRTGTPRARTSFPLVRL